MRIICHTCCVRVFPFPPRSLNYGKYLSGEEVQALTAASPATQEAAMKFLAGAQVRVIARTLAPSVYVCVLLMCIGFSFLSYFVRVPTRARFTNAPLPLSAPFPRAHSVPT